VDAAEFTRSLHVGLGRALIYSREHDVRQFRDVILDACLHCYAYDGLLYGTHGAYMQKLVSGLPDKDFYYGQVLNSLAGSGDDVDAAQRFHFAACLAFDGNEPARQAMYDSFNPGPRTGEHIATDFLKMDGIDGFLFVAEKIGALVIEKGEKVVQGVSFDTCGEEVTRKALLEAGVTNPRIEAYRLALDARERRMNEFSARQDFTSLTYERLFQEVLTTGRLAYISFMKWGEETSDAELGLAAKGLIAANDPEHQLAHLWIFTERTFPLDANAILSLVNSNDRRVGRAAMTALEKICHPAVRELALRSIETRAQCRGQAIALIAGNFEPGDHRLVLRWFRDEQDPDSRHALGLDLRAFLERHPDEETRVPMLIALYEHGPCSFCREDAVKRLLELNALSSELRTECAWDANFDIRDLVVRSVDSA
jgi:hypothetical protein